MKPRFCIEPWIDPLKETFPKGPCTQIGHTLALKCSLYRHIGPKVYTIWIHGPLGLMKAEDLFWQLSLGV